MNIHFHFRLGLDANYPSSILNQSKLGEFFAPLIHSLELTTSSSKGDPLELLEEEIENERSGSGNLISKHAVEAMKATASAPLNENKNAKSNRRRSSSISVKEEKEKSRPKSSPLFRSLSSLTLMGSKKSSEPEKAKPLSRVRSASTVQLSEVVDESILIRY